MIRSGALKYKPSLLSIKFNRFVRFVRVGAFLHIMGLIGLIVFIIGLQKVFFYFDHEIYGSAYLWLFFSIWGLTIPFFSGFDALGRYQNYKQIKDSLYKRGFDPRLIKPFANSKCQRDAVLIAAEDLEIADQVKKVYHNMGYRWYHILPDAFIKNPLVLFYRIFWQRILFTKHYQLQNFYW